MFFLKMIRKAGKVVRGGASPCQLALGAFLGVLIGFIPGFNLLLAAAVAALIVFNVHLGTALIGIGIGRLCALLLAPVSFRIGYVVIHNTGLEDAFRWILNAPVLALGGFDRYSMTGAIPLILLVSGFYAYLMIRGVKALRNVFYKESRTSSFIGTITGKKPVAVLIRLVFGKKKEFEAKKPLLRKKGVIAVLIVVSLIAMADLFALNAAARWGAVSALGRINGAEVNANRATLSLLRGRFRLEGLQMTDPDNPRYNRLQVDAVAADLSTLDLLAGRLTVNELRLQGIRTNERREKAGEVFEVPPPPPPAPEPDPEEPALFEYFRDTERVERMVRLAADALERQRKRSKQREEQREEPRRFIFETAETEGYRNTSAVSLLRRHPALTLRKITVGGISAAPPLDDHTVVITNLSSAPVLSGRPTELTVPGHTAENDAPLWVGLNLHDTAETHEMRANITGIMVGRGRPADISEAVGVNLSRGSANISAQGRFDTGMLDIPFHIVISDLEMDAKEGAKVLGLEPSVAGLALSALNTLELHGRLYGRPMSPRVSIDTTRTAEALKERLLSIGADEVRGIFDAEVPDLKSLTDRLRRKEDEKGENDEQEDGNGSLEERIRSLF